VKRVENVLSIVAKIVLLGMSASKSVSLLVRNVNDLSAGENVSIASVPKISNG
jgi:hypothetical protein